MVSHGEGFWCYNSSGSSRTHLSLPICIVIKKGGPAGRHLTSMHCNTVVRDSSSIEWASISSREIASGSTDMSRCYHTEKQLKSCVCESVTKSQSNQRNLQDHNALCQPDLSFLVMLVSQCITSALPFFVNLATDMSSYRQGRIPRFKLLSHDIHN